jgi:anti-sigma regulatory factor (Ser/Thr protein kinase)
MRQRTILDAPATLDGLARLLTAFRTFLTAAGVPAPIQRDMHAAIDELLANVLMHGDAAEARRDLRAIVTCDPSQVAVELVDAGAAFDPVAYDRDNHGLPHVLSVGGVGIRLARHWLDELTYERRGGANHVVLVKRRPPSSEW